MTANGNLEVLCTGAVPLVRGFESSCGQREPEWEEPLAAGVLVDLYVYVYVYIYELSIT